MRGYELARGWMGGSEIQFEFHLFFSEIQLNAIVDPHGSYTFFGLEPTRFSDKGSFVN
jgi:hypothetical protein